MRALAILFFCFAALPVFASTLNFTAKINGYGGGGFSNPWVVGPDGDEPFDIGAYSLEELGFDNTYIYGLATGKVRGTLQVTSLDSGQYFVECYFNDLMWNACGQSTQVANTSGGIEISFGDGGYTQQIEINPLNKRRGTALYYYADDSTRSAVTPDGIQWFVKDGYDATIWMTYHIVGKDVSEIPLPAGGVLLATGILGLALKRRRI